MLFTNSDNFVPALVTVVLLESSSAAQPDRAPMLRFVSPLTNMTVFDIFSGCSDCSDERSLSLLLNDTEMKRVERNEFMKAA